MFWWVVCFRHRVAHASKVVLNCLLKFDMFQWVDCFEVWILRNMFRGEALAGSQNRCRLIWWHIFDGTHSPHIKTHAKTLRTSDTFTTCCWCNVERPLGGCIDKFLQLKGSLWHLLKKFMIVKKKDSNELNVETNGMSWMVSHVFETWILLSTLNWKHLPCWVGEQPSQGEGVKHVGSHALTLPEPRKRKPGFWRSLRLLRDVEA